MKHLHICDNEKFITPFISLIRDNFTPDEHSFIVIGENKYNISSDKNVTLVKDVKGSYFYINKKIQESDKVYFHSLINNHIVYLLFFQRKHLKKGNWVIWGSDLYRYLERQKSIKSIIKEFIRRSVIKNISGLITYITGDYELAKKWYGAKGKLYNCAMYPSNLYKEINLISRENSNKTIAIQVGNSADSRNNHLEVLEKLQRYNDMDIEIICPLAYGDKIYAKKVINYGTEIFGDKFIPITEFMSFDKYLDILAKIDIAIFNHKRQQAMGNITTLLGLGKKVYIREEITTWQFCIDHDLKVHSANGNYDDLFEEMDEEIKQKNIKNVKTEFSEEKLVEDWRRIFDA